MIEDPETQKPQEKDANGKVKPPKMQLVTTDLTTVRNLKTSAPEGTFPNYKATFPDNTKRRIVHDKMWLTIEQDEAAEAKQKLWVRVGVNPRLLAEILLTIAEIKEKNGDKTDCGVELHIPMGIDHRPLMVLASSYQRQLDITGLVMPLRLHEDRAYEKFNAELHYSQGETTDEKIA